MGNAVIPYQGCVVDGVTFWGDLASFVCRALKDGVFVGLIDGVGVIMAYMQLLNVGVEIVLVRESAGLALPVLCTSNMLFLLMWWFKG